MILSFRLRPRPADDNHRSPYVSLTRTHSILIVLCITILLLTTPFRLVTATLTKDSETSDVNPSNPDIPFLPIGSSPKIPTKSRLIPRHGASDDDNNDDDNEIRLQKRAPSRILPSHVSYIPDSTRIAERSPPGVPVRLAFGITGPVPDGSRLLNLHNTHKSSSTSSAIFSTASSTASSLLSTDESKSFLGTSLFSLNSDNDTISASSSSSVHASSSSIVSDKVSSTTSSSASIITGSSQIHGDFFSNASWVVDSIGVSYLIGGSIADLDSTASSSSLNDVSIFQPPVKANGSILLVLSDHHQDNMQDDPTYGLVGHSSHMAGDGTIITLFGRSQDGTFQLGTYALVYHTETLTFTKRYYSNTPPPKRAFHSSIYDTETDSIYIRGGIICEGTSAIEAYTIHRLIVSSMTWESVFRYNEVSDDSDTYDIISSSGTQSTISSIWNDYLIFCFGTISGGTHLETSDKCVMFDRSTSSWSQLEHKATTDSRLPLPRIGATLTNVAPQNISTSSQAPLNAFMFGGLSIHGDYLNDMWYVTLSSTNTDSNTPTEIVWSPVNITGSVPDPRAFHSAAFFGNQLAICGGEGYSVMSLPLFFFNKGVFQIGVVAMMVNQSLKSSSPNAYIPLAIALSLGVVLFIVGALFLTRKSGRRSNSESSDGSCSSNDIDPKTGKHTSINVSCETQPFLDDDNMLVKKGLLDFTESTSFYRYDGYKAGQSHDGYKYYFSGDDKTTYCEDDDDGDLAISKGRFTKRQRTGIDTDFPRIAHYQKHNSGDALDDGYHADFSGDSPPNADGSDDTQSCGTSSLVSNEGNEHSTTNIAETNSRNAAFVTKAKATTSTVGNRANSNHVHDTDFTTSSSDDQKDGKHPITSQTCIVDSSSTYLRPLNRDNCNHIGSNITQKQGKQLVQSRTIQRQTHAYQPNIRTKQDASDVNPIDHQQQLEQQISLGPGSLVTPPSGNSSGGDNADSDEGHKSILNERMFDLLTAVNGNRNLQDSSSSDDNKSTCCNESGNNSSILDSPPQLIRLPSKDNRKDSHSTAGISIVSSSVSSNGSSNGNSSGISNTSGSKSSEVGVVRNTLQQKHRLTDQCICPQCGINSGNSTYQQQQGNNPSMGYLPTMIYNNPVYGYPWNQRQSDYPTSQVPYHVDPRYNNNGQPLQPELLQLHHQQQERDQFFNNSQNGSQLQSSFVGNSSQYNHQMLHQQQQQGGINNNSSNNAILKTAMLSGKPVVNKNGLVNCGVDRASVRSGKSHSSSLLRETISNMGATDFAFELWMGSGSTKGNTNADGSSITST